MFDQAWEAIRELAKLPICWGKLHEYKRKHVLGFYSNMQISSDKKEEHF